MVRTDDARAQQLRAIVADVVVGDLLNLPDVRTALEGVGRAYFNFPVGEGLVEAAVNRLQTVEKFVEKRRSLFEPE